MDEKAPRQIIKGIVYSEFDDVVGPVAICFIPGDLGSDLLKNVASLTIDSYMNTDRVPDRMLLLPFPQFFKKGLMQAVVHPDSRKRGALSTGTLTVLFDEEGDSVFYKYQKDFEAPFEKAVKALNTLMERNAPRTALRGPLEQFHAELSQLLAQLSVREKPLPAGLEEFPTSAPPPEAEVDYNCKILVLGDPSVGKTSTILRFTDKAFNRSYVPTLGVNISIKYIRHQDVVVQLFLWDLAGQSKYQRIRAQMYAGAVGAVIVYDVTNRQSFESVPKWHKDVTGSSATGSAFQAILCGNKCDLTTDLKVTPQEGSTLAQSLGVDFLETSALSGENVTEAFTRLVGRLITSFLPLPPKK